MSSIIIANEAEAVNLSDVELDAEIAAYEAELDRLGPPSDREYQQYQIYAERRNREDGELLAWLAGGGSDNLYTNDLVESLEVAELAA